MHRTDDRSTSRFVMVQLPAFAGGILCLGNVLHNLDFSSAYNTNMSNFQNAGVSFGIGVVLLVFGIVLWKQDR